MKISNHAFSEKEIEDLEIYGDNQKNGRLRLRYVVLLMTAQGILSELIASIIGINLRTTGNWFQQYVAEGSEGLNSFNYKAKRPKLITKLNGPNYNLPNLVFHGTIYA